MDYKAIAEAALEKRGSLVESLRAIDSDAAKTDAEKREQVERVTAEIEAVEVEARDAVQKGEREAEVRSLAERAGALMLPAAGKRDAEAVDLNAQFRAVALGEAREFEIDLRAAGTNTAVSKTGLPAGGGAAWVANTVPVETFVSQVLESMRDRSPIFRLARVITTSTGEPLSWPLKNARPTAGKVIEGQPIPKSKGGFDKFTLGSDKYGVIVESTVEALNDSAVPLASILATDAGEAISDAVSTDVVAGLLSAITLGDSSGVVLTADDVVGMVYDVRSGYRRNGVYLTNDATLRSLRLLKDADERYLWQPSLVAGEPDRINGYAIETDPNMPLDGTEDAKPLVFGDFSKVVIRQVSGLRVVRSDEYGFDSDIVAWKVTWRGDSGLSDGAALTARTFSAV